MEIYGIIHRQRLRRHFVLLISLLLMLIPLGCGSENQSISFETEPAANSETSSASLTIRWNDTPAQEDSALLRTAALDCEGSGVENVVVKVYDATGNDLVTGGPWPCTASGGRIDRIPVGQDRRFVALAEDADGNARYQGETGGIIIQAGEITQGVVIDALLFIPVLTTPENEEEMNPITGSLNWEDVENADEYLVQIAEDIDFETIIVDETTPATTFAPTTLQPSIPYFWKISAVDAYGNIGAGSEIRSFIVMPVITGAVRTATGEAISGVTITLGDDDTVTTDAAGAYTIAVPDGWNGTVTPSNIRYTFNPESRTYANVTANQTDQNYTGNAVTPTISGFVRNADGGAVSGVTVTFSNDGGTATTNNAGAYSTAVPFGWTGTATPSRSGYNFSPASRTYSNEVTADQPNQNYTGIAITPTLSGIVRNADGGAISGVTVTFSNNGGSATTNNSGAYSTTVPFGWSGTARPSRSGFTFSPASRNYSNVTANQANQNYTGNAIIPTLSGFVRDDDGAISGVTVTFSNNGGTATTNNSGAYSTTVPFGWSGTARPSISGYTFSPASRNYNNVTANRANQNYTGDAVTPTISGLVRDADGDAIGGVTVTFSNNGGSTTTNNSGAYSATVPFNWSGTARPAISGFTFSPASRNYSNVTANQANQNYTGNAVTPTISGLVRDADGGAISGVTVTFSNNGGSATTNNSGAYTTTVPFGWSGTARPSLSGFTFSPASRTYNNVTTNDTNENYTGTTITPIISGFVRTAAGGGLGDVTVTFSNNGGTAVTNSSGAYSRAVPFGWTGTVTPTRSGYGFSPASRDYDNVTATQTNQNYTGNVVTPTISGLVRDADGNAISGVTVTFSNNGGSTTTNNSGAYSATVPFGWSGTARPSLGGYTFNPATRTYNNVTANQANQNYTGTRIAPIISGFVGTAAGGAIGDVTVTFSNNGGTAVTNSSGAYSRAVPFGWTGTVTPTRIGYSFTPASRNYDNVTATQTNQNYTGTALPVVTVTAIDSSASEAAEFPGLGTYRISRTGSTADILRIFFTMGGTAVNGVDYGRIIGPITLDNQQIFQDITLTPLNDQIAEANETAVMTISVNSAYARGTPSSATITILDDD